MGEQQICFETFRLDLASERLWGGEQPVHLRPKTFAVLRYLIERAGQLVLQEELLENVWSEAIVGDAVVQGCIRELRQALGDDAKTPRFIETVFKKGYQFIGEVVSRETAGSQEARSLSPALRSLTPNPQPLTPTLVGRETELAQLHRALEKALGGARQLVFVTGEAGIGKTALVDAFLADIGQRATGNRDQANQKAKGKNQKAKIEDHSLAPNTQHPAPSPWIGLGQCIEHFGAGEAYLPVLEALGQLCRQPDGTRVVALLRQSAPLWLLQLPWLLDAAEREALRREARNATRERMLRELREALDAMTVEKPVVLVLEDLHWCDHSTVDLLAALACRREPARLLVIGTQRPAEIIEHEHPLGTVKHDLRTHGLCTELPLELLGEVAVEDYLVQRFTAGTQRPTSWRALAQVLHRRTDGNPLFLVNVVDDLVQQRIVTGAEDEREVEPGIEAVATRIPENLRKTIEQQVERLKDVTQQMLEAASVAGAEFSTAMLAAAVDGEIGQIDERCEELARRGQFLRALGTDEWPDGTVATRYGFTHALYQQVLYERVGAARRMRLHQRIGARAEAAYGNSAAERAAELAVHFEQGRDYGRAARYLRQAGENALRRVAHQEAIRLLTRGLELLKSLPDTPERIHQELQLQLTLAVPLMTMKGYAAPEVESAYARARELCRQMGDPRLLFPVLWGLWGFYLVRGDLPTARGLAEQGQELVQQLANLDFLLGVQLGLGTILYYCGELTAARSYLEQGVSLYDPQKYRLDRPDGFVQDPGVGCLSYGAQVLWLLGYPNQARETAHRALTLARDLSHPFSLAYGLNHAAGLNLLCREPQRTRELAGQAVALAAEHGFPLWAAMGTILGGWALSEMGQKDKGSARILQGLDVFRATGTGLGRPFFLSLLAKVHEEKGRVEEGLLAVEEALAVVHKNGERFYEAELWRLKGELLLRRGKEATG